MNGVFEFDDKGVILGINITFENKTEKNCWMSLLNVIGGPIPETKIWVCTYPFSDGFHVQRKQVVKT